MADRDFPSINWPLNPRLQCQPKILPKPVRAEFAAEWRLLVDAQGAGRLLGVPRGHVWALRNSGHLPMAVRIGRSVRWRVSELKAWAGAGCPPTLEWTRLCESRP